MIGGETTYFLHNYVYPICCTDLLVERPGPSVGRPFHDVIETETFLGKDYRGSSVTSLLDLVRPYPRGPYRPTRDVGPWSE